MSISPQSSPGPLPVQKAKSPNHADLSPKRSRSRSPRVPAARASPSPTQTTQLTPASASGPAAARAPSPCPSSSLSDDMFSRTPVPLEAGTSGPVRIGGELEDTSGYYVPQVGELILDTVRSLRFKILSVRGKGVYSCVVEVQCLETREPFALKVLRSNDVMAKSGEKEKKVLQKLNSADPNDRRHIIRLYGSFVHQGHLCLQYELMGLSLREVLQKYGSENGLSLEAVKSFARQGFIALYHLKTHRMIHTDSNSYTVKPDNILICSQLRKIKLSDFGTTLEEGENKITDNLVARFYRPPEIYLGYPYDSGVDVWSFACTLFELFTGRVLFPGNSDSHMIKLIIEVKGPIPKKMRTQGKFSGKFFEDFSFVYSKDPLEGPVRVPLAELKKEKNLGVALEPKLKANLPQAPADLQEYLKEVSLLQNLLEQCLEIDPNERITPDLALNHPFLCKSNNNGR